MPLPLPAIYFIALFRRVIVHTFKRKPVKHHERTNGRADRRADRVIIYIPFETFCRRLTAVCVLCICLQSTQSATHAEIAKCLFECKRAQFVKHLKQVLRSQTKIDFFFFILYSFRMKIRFTFLILAIGAQVSCLSRSRRGKEMANGMRLDILSTIGWYLWISLVEHKHFIGTKYKWFRTSLVFARFSNSFAALLYMYVMRRRRTMESYCVSRGKFPRMHQVFHE